MEREPPSDRRRNQRCKPRTPTDEAESPSLDQDRLESLDTQAVQCWRAVEEHRMLVNHFIENIPNFRAVLFPPFFWRS